MARLLGKQIGATVVEVLGPREGRNRFSDGTFSVAVTPTVEVQVFGSGVVRVETNDQSIIVGERASNIGSQKAINTEEIADPGNWSPLAFAAAAADPLIDQDDGLVPSTGAIPIGTTGPTYIRVVVTTPGDGWVHFATKWN